MIDKNVKLRLEDTDESLYMKNDFNGNAVYFLDKELTKPFIGEVYVVFKDKIESEAQYINGSKNGVEYIYNSNQEIEQINQCRGNVIFGVSKEFENRKLKTVSIVYNNNFIKIIEINSNQKDYITLKVCDNKYGNKLPIYLKNLLKLNDEELINYEFSLDNPNLIF